MIEMDFDKNTQRVAFNCWMEGPAIYLDHWALRNIARNQDLNRQFFELFSKKGTLLFSQANLAEIAGNAGEDVTLIRKFLEQIGLKWFPLDFNPQQVAERELAGYEAAAANTEFLEKYAPTIGHGKILTPESFTLSNVVDIVQAADMRPAVLEFFGKFKAAILKVFEDRRDLVSRVFFKPRPKPIRSSGSPTLDIFRDLERVVLTQKFSLSGNDVMDFFHAVVALQYADLLCLDKKWTELTSQVRYPIRAKVFKESTLPEFFEAFRNAN